MRLDRLLRRPPDALVGGVLRARRAVDRIHRALVPPPVLLIERAFGLADTFVLGALVQLGVPEALRDGPRSTAALAEQLGCHDAALGRVLRLAATRGYLEGDDPWRANDATEVLREDHAESVAGLVRFFASAAHGRWWASLADAARSGHAAVRVAEGQGFWDFLAAHPQTLADYHRGMENVSRLSREALVGRLALPANARLCDLGGGTGANLAALLHQAPDARGVLFDLPEVVARSGPVLAAAGVTARVDVIGGSFFEQVPRGCDLYLLQAILHAFDDETCVRLLRAVREALGERARVVVVENVAVDQPGEHVGRLLDLEMLVVTDGGRERPVAHFHRLFEAAGLRPGAVTVLPTGVGLVEATR